MSLMAVIYNINLYFVIYGLWFSYSNHLKLSYMFYILLYNLNCVILSVLVYYTIVTCFISNYPATVLIYKIYLLILNLRTRHRWVVNFMHWLFHPQGKMLWYPPNRRLGGPHSWTGHFEDKNLLHLSGCELQIAQPLA